MVYLTIADVDPDETQDSKQEMWLIQVHARKCNEIALCCSQNEWKQVLQLIEIKLGDTVRLMRLSSALLYSVMNAEIVVCCCLL